MGSKHHKIKTAIKKAQRKGKPVPNPKELASCSGKIRYESYAKAVDKNKTKAGLVKAYKCKFCAYYHVGRKPS